MSSMSPVTSSHTPIRHTSTTPSRLTMSPLTIQARNSSSSSSAGENMSIYLGFIHNTTNWPILFIKVALPFDLTQLFRSRANYAYLGKILVSVEMLHLVHTYSPYVLSRRICAEIFSPCTDFLLMVMTKYDFGFCRFIVTFWKHVSPPIFSHGTSQRSARPVPSQPSLSQIRAGTSWWWSYQVS